MPEKATQSRHPWRATARTILAAALALLPMLPTLAEQLGVAAYPAVATVLAVTGAVTRLLAMPAVDEWLRRFAPWLATTPPN